MNPNPTPLLEVSGLRTWFAVRGGILQQERGWVRAVDGVDLTIAPGETLALVGESGCGKTTVGRSILRLVEPRAGAVRFEGIDILELAAGELRAYRKRIQIVFQDSTSALDPRQQARDAIAEGLDAFGMSKSRIARTERVAELMEMVRLDPDLMTRYPHEFSGGQKQRICIARALAVEPRLLICDESVSALDVSIQAQILNLLRDLKSRLGLAYLFITHDLGVVGNIADRIAVMYLGKIVETGTVGQILDDPQHPYTKALLASVPSLDPAQRGAQAGPAGEAPDPANPPSGCHFHPRCPYAFERCAKEAPTMEEIAGRASRCFL
ncbi:MAG: ABC transporter ATP-binding protein [Alphaproteobacteria bacterium]|nr:ABC transporter ATP-binding protein [Alphaproteobacteria bacterium]